MRGAGLRVLAQRASRRKQAETGWLAALCEGAFAHRPDGALFFPWGALGPGYRVPDAESAVRLRRALRRILAAGLLAVPAAALLAVASGRLAAALWLGGASSGTLCLAVARLARGLERSAERLRAVEARARIAAALRAGPTRRLAGCLCLLGVACAGLAVARGGGDLLSAAGGAALAAAALAGGLLAWRRRVGRR